MSQARKAAIMALATALAIPAEGLRQYAYHDPGGMLTVCYGHTGKDIVPGRKYDLEECRKMLDKDMSAALATVERCRPGLPPQVAAAFADAVFNLGQVIVCDKANSTAARLLAEGKIEAACNELPRWNKDTIAGVKVALPGLTKRRELERKICLEGLI
jgi:GH24 family phage-related lysozyme (muramidase)